MGYLEWENTWFIMTGCWDICYLVALAAIMWIWRPSSRNHIQMNYKQMSLDGRVDPDDQSHPDEAELEDQHGEKAHSDCSSVFSEIRSDISDYEEDETPTEEFLSNSMTPSARATPMNRSQRPSARPETSKAHWSGTDSDANQKSTPPPPPVAKSLFPKPKKTYTLSDPMS